MLQNSLYGSYHQVFDLQHLPEGDQLYLDLFSAIIQRLIFPPQSDAAAVQQLL